ncbi:hypothetical protein C1645_735974 [Glomus cerebriforme]|uniref:Uncharacterized protein n=1 Tax=Glomus cerebriforme TaxID=658196 RepID=A0A397T929_9GLOM|nr:hypothetical protein C1645_735974 [Glomus cerebriforme]
MGVVHAFNQNESNLRDYIQRITFMDDGHIMILCMFKLQADDMSKFKYFMVDMSYKHVFGEINELEFNVYDEDNNSEKQNSTSILKSQNQRYKGNVKGVKNFCWTFYKVFFMKYGQEDKNSEI